MHSIDASVLEMALSEQFTLCPTAMTSKEASQTVVTLTAICTYVFMLQNECTMAKVFLSCSEPNTEPQCIFKTNVKTNPHDLL